MSLLVVLPFSRRDQHLAIANLEWIAEMGHVEQHDILLVVDEDVDVKMAKSIASSCFRKVTVLPIDKCSTSKWPISQNHTWKRAVDYIDHFKLWPFLYLESDAIPLRYDWLNRIDDEYRAVGRPFLGYKEYADDPDRVHMNGVGVYGDIYKFAPSLMDIPTYDDGRNYVAFDWQGGKDVVPSMYVSRLIQFTYKQEDKLLADESLSWLNPDAVVFHTCKNLRLIELLKAKKNGTILKAQPQGSQTVRQEAHNLPLPGSIPGPAMSNRKVSCDIFIKTYAKVAQWHEQAMRSIARFATGFRKTVVVGDQPVEGYQEMQVVKLNADLYTDADYILFTDSDCVFCTPVDPGTYFRGGKSIWLYRNWTAALKQEGDAVMRWHRGMEKFFGIEPPHEFMCRHPEMIPRWLLVAFRMFCQMRHGVTMEEWVLKDKEFADWNMLGMYAWLYHRECFHWINQDEETPPPITVKQFWGGHAPFAEALPEIERILAGGPVTEHVPPGPVLRSPPATKPVKRGKAKKPHRSPEQQAAINARMAKARSARKLATA